MVIGTPTVLNLIPGGVMKVIHVNQVNENIEIQFRIMNGAQPFNVPEGVSCTIRGTKGDNFGYAADVAVTAGSNIVTVTLTEQLTAERRWAMYQLDHFKPKSKYPYLCVSFFNLQPSCANCNQHKSTDEAEFNLYTADKAKLEPLHFKFTPDDIIKFVTSGDEEIDVILDGEKSIVDSQKRLFKIDLVYKEHLDVAKEALVRMYINDKYYRKQLQASLDYLFPNGVEAPERFYWGNYLHPNEVHRRPLSMLIQDVVSFPWKGRK